MQTILVDTGVWYAIFDPRDRPKERDEMIALGDILENERVVVPWPVTYETMCTRFTDNRIALEAFERLLKRPTIHIISDDKYRDEAVDECFESSLRQKRPLSLTDCLLRGVLRDPALRIKYFATFNERDFVDVCAPKGIEIFP